MTEPPRGIYLHVPFCVRRCDYCDFTTYAGRDDAIDAYVAATAAEIDRLAAAGPAAVAPHLPDAPAHWPAFDTVFVGGGTPTHLPAGALEGLLGRLRDRFDLAAGAEVTVEANPETVDRPRAAALRAAGVSRVSLGAQSFAPHVLDQLGRWHDPRQPVRAVAALREAGIARLSLDLIYGAPAETAADWDATLRATLDTGVTHVSAYALTVEPGTPYAARARAVPALLPDEDVQAARMAAADAALTAAGLARYEVSNWATPGDECRHNLGYWRGGDWLGIGPGAHGHWQGRRWWTHRSLDRYLAAAGADPTAGSEVLAPAQRRTERLLLGLRLAEGVPLDDVGPLDTAALRRMADAGLLEVAGGRLRLRPAGFPLAQAVTVRLLAA